MIICFAAPPAGASALYLCLLPGRCLLIYLFSLFHVVLRTPPYATPPLPLYGCCH